VNSGRIARSPEAGEGAEDREHRAFHARARMRLDDPD
jgi:hypothetical protein